MLKIVNVDKLFALRRSGSHAIAYWIEANSDRTFFNDRSLKFRTYKWHDASLIYGMEDHPLDLVCSPYESTNILIIRDLANWWASLNRKKVDDPGWGTRRQLKLNYPPVTVNNWVQYANEFVGNTNYLSNKIVINYNMWVVSRSYRNCICDQLGMSKSDRRLNSVSPQGKGSSFVGMKYDGIAQKMKVTERWKWLRGKPNLVESIINNAEAIELNQLIFGELVNANTGYWELWSSRA